MRMIAAYLTNKNGKVDRENLKVELIRFLVLENLNSFSEYK